MILYGVTKVLIQIHDDSCNNTKNIHSLKWRTVMHSYDISMNDECALQSWRNCVICMQSELRMSGLIMCQCSMQFLEGKLSTDFNAWESFSELCLIKVLQALHDTKSISRWSKNRRSLRKTTRHTLKQNLVVSYVTQAGLKPVAVRWSSNLEH